MITVYLTTRYGSPLTLYIEGSFALFIDEGGVAQISISGGGSYALKESFDEATEAIVEARLRLIRVRGGE
jgi:hypothetical protein